VKNRVNAIGGDSPTNGAVETIESSLPYVATFKLRGTADMLFHRWNVEGIESKAGAAKGSKAKKTDDVESYVYRNDANEICVPGEYVRGAIINAAKYRQDPRSPRKSAMDLFKAAVISLTPLAPILAGKGTERMGEASSGQASLGMVPLQVWDYLHKCRVTIQRNGITRSRPAIKAGWEAEFQFMVQLPEYVSADVLHEVLVSAGRLIGIGDFRPSYGRFSVVSFETGLAE
jgi:hypothetical protein